jgi:hypothetical protein
VCVCVCVCTCVYNRYVTNLNASLEKYSEAEAKVLVL